LSSVRFIFSSRQRVTNGPYIKLRNLKQTTYVLNRRKQKFYLHLYSITSCVTSSHYHIWLLVEYRRHTTTLVMLELMDNIRSVDVILLPLPHSPLNRTIS
jgi:hypothetical protein